MSLSGQIKGFTIVVAGKGGTGKTLTSALLVRNQVKHGAVLAIDADPDSNLPEALGVKIKHTVAHVRERLLDYKTRHTETKNVTPQEVMERGVMEALAEQRGFDLLVMGRGEGEGCYCAVNHILRAVIDAQVRNYPTVVIDSEAGLEHISRRTARDVDVMLVVTDASAKGVNTARRVKELAAELKIDFGRILVLLNKIDAQTQNIMEAQVADAGLELLGIMPFDPQVAQNDALGKPVWELPDDNPVVRAAAGFCAKLDAIREEKVKRFSVAGNL